MGIIEFNWAANILSGLSFDRQALSAAMDGYVAYGSTNIGAGLQSARTMLENTGNLAAGKVVTTSMTAYRGTNVQTITDGETDAGRMRNNYWASRTSTGAVTIDLESVHHINKITLYWLRSMRGRMSISCIAILRP